MVVRLCVTFSAPDEPQKIAFGAEEGVFDVAALDPASNFQVWDAVTRRGDDCGQYCML